MVRRVERYQAEQTDDSIADYDMLKALIDLLSQANSSYKRIFAFRNLFCEFIENNKMYTST